MQVAQTKYLEIKVKYSQENLQFMKGIFDGLVVFEEGRWSSWLYKDYLFMGTRFHPIFRFYTVSELFLRLCRARFGITCLLKAFRHVWNTKSGFHLGN